jgi:hypothetical protein
VAMVADSVEFLYGHGLKVFYDAEHFFDGYKRNPEFALRVLEAAATNDVDTLVLCDTNGGSLPHEVQQVVGQVQAHVGTDVIIGIHCHDDTGCAVANSMAAVAAGARHVQGTLNGLGERTGNCNLTTVIPNLQLKLGYECLPEGRLERLTAVSRSMRPSGRHVKPSFSCRFGMIVVRLALPVRSPRPFSVPWTCPAPASTAAIELATAQPVSSWQWMPTTTQRCATCSMPTPPRSASLPRAGTTTFSTHCRPLSTKARP